MLYFCGILCFFVACEVRFEREFLNFVCFRKHPKGMLLFKKKIVHKFVVSSPKKSPFRSKIEEITRQKSCINTTKSKIANESPSVLDFIVNTSIKSKKLTKDQEKGLISRLQNNHNFKNSK